MLEQDFDEGYGVALAGCAGWVEAPGEGAEVVHGADTGEQGLDEGPGTGGKQEQGVGHIDGVGQLAAHGVERTKAALMVDFYDVVDEHAAGWHDDAVGKIAGHNGLTR